MPIREAALHLDDRSQVVAPGDALTGRLEFFVDAVDSLDATVTIAAEWCFGTRQWHEGVVIDLGHHAVPPGSVELPFALVAPAEPLSREEGKGHHAEWRLRARLRAVGQRGTQKCHAPFRLVAPPSSPGRDMTQAERTLLDATGRRRKEPSAGASVLGLQLLVRSLFGLRHRGALKIEGLGDLVRPGGTLDFTVTLNPSRPLPIEGARASLEEVHWLGDSEGRNRILARSEVATVGLDAPPLVDGDRPKTIVARLSVPATVYPSFAWNDHVVEHSVRVQVDLAGWGRRSLRSEQGVCIRHAVPDDSRSPLLDLVATLGRDLPPVAPSPTSALPAHFDYRHPLRGPIVLILALLFIATVVYAPSAYVLTPAAAVWLALAARRRRGLRVTFDELVVDFGFSRWRILTRHVTEIRRVELASKSWLVLRVEPAARATALASVFRHLWRRGPHAADLAFHQRQFHQDLSTVEAALRGACATATDGSPSCQHT